MKKCSKCGEWLVASSVNFNKQKKGKYGLKSKCKECCKKYREQNKEAKAEYSKKYYEANKQAILEQQKEYKEQNKEAIAERGKKYREQNKEVIAERKKKYYEANKEALAERKKKYNKEYRQTPQGQVVEFNRHNRRRAKEQNQGKGVTAEQWLEMMNFFNWECAYSGKYIGGDSKDRTIDHIEPLNNGGENEIWNCIPMDRSLNSSKSDKEMLEWYIKQPFCTAERLLKIYNWQEYAKNKYANLIVNE